MSRVHIMSRIRFSLVQVAFLGILFILCGLAGTVYLIMYIGNKLGLNWRCFW